MEAWSWPEPCPQGRLRKAIWHISTWSSGACRNNPRASQHPSCKETANPAGCTLAFCSYCLLMTLKENIRLSRFDQLLRQERKVLLFKLHIAVPSPCRNLCIIRMGWLLFLLFLLFSPLIFRYMPWDGTIYSFPCTYNSQHAIDAASCLDFGANKNECCSGDNIPQEILQGKHKPWNLGLSSRKPWKQSKPRSQICTYRLQPCEQWLLT